MFYYTIVLILWPLSHWCHGFSSTCRVPLLILGSNPASTTQCYTGPIENVLSFWICKDTFSETQSDETKFDKWADSSVHLLLQKSSKRGCEVYRWAVHCRMLEIFLFFRTAIYLSGLSYKHSTALESYRLWNCLYFDSIKIVEALSDLPSKSVYVVWMSVCLPKWLTDASPYLKCT